MSVDIYRRPCRSSRRGDDRGSASIEFVVLFGAALTVAIAASDVGVMLRGDIALHGSVRDAVRVLSRTPLAEDGLPLKGGLDLADEMMRERLARAGLSLAPLGEPPNGALCATDRAICVRMDPIPGSAEALGRGRALVTVWAAAEAPTQFLDVFMDRATEGDSSVSLVASMTQVHAR